MVQVNKKRSAYEFVEKIAKMFGLKRNCICITYQFKVDGETVKYEIEGRDDGSLSIAIDILKDFSKLTVEFEMKPAGGEFLSSDGPRKITSKEVVAEQLKREMGLHNDQGIQKRGYQDSKWTERCDELMKEDSRFLLDCLKSRMAKVLGDAGYVLNPVQV